MISIVCVYNDEVVFNEYLVKSLEDQTEDFEIIKINNSSHRFKSAAEALNFGGRQVKGTYIMFVHQDVDLMSKSWLSDAEKLLELLPAPGIVGVAGCNEAGIVFTNLEHGKPPIPASDTRINKTEKVQTVDECLFIVPKLVFDRIGFDETVCGDWHLYAADFSLCCKNLGYGVYVLPMFIYHLSSGTKARRFLGIFHIKALPKEYYNTLGKLLKKHGGRYTSICMTCGQWNTTEPLLIQRARYFIKYCRKRLSL